jgi:hypothetical protein
MGDCRLRAHRGQGPGENGDADNADCWQNESRNPHFATLLQARLGFQENLRPLQIPPPIGGVGHPRCRALYRDWIPKIQVAPKHAIEAAQLFCLLNYVLNGWPMHV